MSKKNASNALQKLAKADKYIPLAELTSLFRNLTDAYRDNLATQRDIAKISAQRDVLISSIVEKHTSYRLALNEVFSERRNIIDKSFEIINRGISEKNEGLIVQGFSQISELVAKSPFADISQVQEQINNGGVIEI